MKHDKDTIKKHFENIIEEKKKDNEARKARKDGKQNYLELIKKTLLNKAAPQLLPKVLLSKPKDEPGGFGPSTIPGVTGPISPEAREFARRKAAGEPVRKPKIRAFIEYERPAQSFFTHYIAHPCPYCMPGQLGCPIHGENDNEMVVIAQPEIMRIKKMLMSGNERDKASALRTLYFYAQADPKTRKFIEETFPGMDIEGIIHGQNYLDFAMQLSQLMSAYKKPPGGSKEGSPPSAKGTQSPAKTF